MTIHGIQQAFQNDDSSEFDLMGDLPTSFASLYVYGRAGHESLFGFYGEYVDFMVAN